LLPSPQLICPPPPPTVPRPITCTITVVVASVFPAAPDTPNASAPSSKTPPHVATFLDMASTSLRPWKRMGKVRGPRRPGPLGFLSRLADHYFTAFTALTSPAP